jgi:predicted DNA-binding protein
MTKRAKVTPQNAPQVDVLKSTEQEQVGRPYEEDYAKKYGRPTSFRLPDELTERIRAMAEAEGVGISKLVEFILTRFVKDYDAERISLPKKRQEVYELEFDELE